MQLGRLIEGLNVRLADARHAPVRICDITEDSRTVQPGSLYIARRGDSTDGNRFIADAITAGAVAVLSDNPDATLPDLPPHAVHPPHPDVALLTTTDIAPCTAQLAERFYGGPSSKLLLFGVTGTNGKTTTTYLVHQILNALHIRAGLIGTVFVDDGTEVAEAAMTTPPALEISRTLARMLDAGCSAGVLEVSSHSLSQGRVAAMAFDAAAFTNLTGDHLDYHKTMEAYAGAKAGLFAMLPATGVAVVNADDAQAARMVQGCRAPVYGTSLLTGKMPAGWTPMRAIIRKATRWGTEATFTGPWGSVDVSLPFVGPHNLMNALQAAGVVWAVAHSPGGKGFEGIDAAALTMEAIAGALAHAALPPGRLQCLTLPEDEITVYVDYAHTDDALRTVLTVFRDIMPRGGQGRLIVVFGCGGDRDATKRPRMGAVAAELADRVIVTSDNPRTEDPRQIIDAVVAGMPQQAWAHTAIEPDRETAIHAAIASAHAGDVVIIAGKGHENYQILPAPTGPGERRTTTRRAFDDRLVARDALMRRGIDAQNPAPTIIARPPTHHPHAAPNSSRHPRTDTA